VIRREVPQEKMLNSTCRSGKGNEEDFETEAAFQEKSSWLHFHYTPACSAIIMQ